MRRNLSVLLILFLSLAVLAGCGLELPAATEIAQTAEADAHSTPGVSPTVEEDTETEDPPILGPVDTVLNAWLEPDREIYPYYYLLDEPKQQAYALLYTGALTGQETIAMGGFVEEDDIVEVFTAVMNDHPEIFWVDCDFIYDSMDGAVSAVMPDYNSHAAFLPGSQARFEAAASDIIETVADMSDVEKERYVHDWLTEHVVYDMDAYDAQNAYSAIVEGRAVCAGYAIAFQYLMQRLDVPCYLCEGQGIDAETGQDNHAWNIVVLDNEPYNVDVTWNDFEDEDLSFTYYGYYNVADDVFSEDHIREGLAASLPACTATDLSFEGIYDMTVHQAVYRAVMREKGIHEFISTRDEFINRVKGELVARGGEEFTLRFLMSGYGLSDEIDQALSGEALDEPIFYAAGDELGFNGYSYGYSWEIISYDLVECPIILFTITPYIYPA